MLQLLLKTKSLIYSKDINVGVAGQVAEVRAAHQALQQRLFDRFFGTSPQLLPFERTLSTNITCWPVTAK